MDFWGKLDELTRERGKAKVSNEAGLPLTAISNYISKRQLPRIDAAYKLAKALGVSLDWLLDDTAESPEPKKGKASPSSLSDRELMLEVARRHRIEILSVLDALDEVEKENWEAVPRELHEWKIGDPVPTNPTAQRIVALYDSLDLSAAELRYNPAYFSMSNHSLMPGKERPTLDFDPAQIHERFRKLQDNDGLKWVGARLYAAPGAKRHPPIQFRDGSDRSTPTPVEDKFLEILVLKARVTEIEQRFRKMAGVTLDEYARQNPDGPAKKPPQKRK